MLLTPAPDRTALRLLLLLPLLIITWGCDDSVNPFVESDRYFSVFGALDMKADTQYVRVIPLDTSLVVSEQEPIDARVFLTDLNVGSTVEWTDSLFVFRDGSRGHVFYSPLRIQPEHRYRLEVVRSDGAASVAETTVPAIPAAEIAEVNLLVYSSGRIEAVQNVTWSGVDRAPAVVEMWYRFSGSPRSRFLDIRIEYPTEDAAPSEPGWTVVTQLTQDRGRIGETIRPEDYLFLGMGMRIVVFDDQFLPPGGVFDPDILSQPGAFSNVDNGFGFVGSVGRFDVEWVLDAETLA
ncbi:MAG: hypothetical protein R3178_10930, partial [Rhodothermales bacterium]|nr:hypothetical protein [Rhodothermales bacterium]